MKVFKKINFVWKAINVYDDITDYIEHHHLSDRIKDAIDTIKSGIDKLAAIFPDVQFLKEKFVELFPKKGK